MKNFISRLLATIAFLGALATTAQAESVVIQSLQNNKFAGLKGTRLAASFGAPQAKVLSLVHFTSDIVAFVDPLTRRYLEVDPAAPHLLTLGSTQHSQRALFAMSDNGGGVALRSRSSGKYLRAGIGQQTLFGAASPHVAGWERFRIIPVAQPAINSDNAGVLERIAGNWQLAGLSDRNMRLFPHPPEAVRQGHFRIQQDGRFTFTAGCNTLSGRISAAAGENGIRFGNVISTRMNCHNAAYALERAVAGLLPQIGGAIVRRNTRLMLQYNDARAVAIDLHPL